MPTRTDRVDRFLERLLREGPAECELCGWAGDSYSAVKHHPAPTHTVHSRLCVCVCVSASEVECPRWQFEILVEELSGDPGEERHQARIFEDGAADRIGDRHVTEAEEQAKTYARVLGIPYDKPKRR